MKIGLLTFAWDNNAGQFWQAVSTYRNLCLKFPKADVEIVRVRHIWNPREGKMPRRVLLEPLRARRYIRGMKAYNHGRDTLMRFSHASCLTHDYDEASKFLHNQSYDLLITGADVCLKPLPENLVIGGIPLHWMSPSIGGEKVMFASSADVTIASDLSVSQRDRVRHSIQGLNFIGVRDQMTYDLVRAIEPEVKNLHLVPDPTFTLENNDDWRHQAKSEIPLTPKGKKLALLHLPDTQETARAIEVLKSKGFHVVSILGKLPGVAWAGSLTPQAWAGMSNIVDLVVTVSFHESVFALKQGNAVLAVDAAPNRFHPSNGASKTKCLMSEFGLTETNHYNFLMMPFDERIFSEKVEACCSRDYRPCVELANTKSLDHWDMLGRIKKNSIVSATA